MLHEIAVTSSLTSQFNRRLLAYIVPSTQVLNPTWKAMTTIPFQGHSSFQYMKIMAHPAHRKGATTTNSPGSQTCGMNGRSFSESARIVTRTMMIWKLEVLALAFDLHAEMKDISYPRYMSLAHSSFFGAHGCKTIVSRL